MYNYEERKRAAEEYIRQDFNARATIRELGYPSMEDADPREMKNREKANVIGALRNKYPLRDLLEQLRWQRAVMSIRQRRGEAGEIRGTERGSQGDLRGGKGRYVYRRLHEKLKVAGRTVSEKVIRRLMTEEGLGYTLTLDGLINTAGDSPLCFRPLEPRPELEANLVWKKYQSFSRAAELFLKELKGLFSA